MIGKKALLEFLKNFSTPTLVLHSDAPKFTIVDVNEAYLNATKSQREDLIGKGIFEAFPDYDSDTTTDEAKNLTLSLNTVIKTHKKHQMAIQKYDIPIRGTSEFELKYWELENIPLFDDDGKLNLIAHCSIDVTNQIKTEKQFKEFEYFFKNSNDFSCIANTEGYIEIANSSFNTVLGYSQNELTTKPFIDFVHHDDLTDTLQAYDQLKSGAPLIHFINRFRKKDESYLWLDWNATPNLISGKLYCIARDVTERKKTENELKKLNEELEQRVKERTQEVEKALHRFEYVTKATSDAIWDWDFENNLVYRAEGFRIIFGFDMEELNLPDANWENYIHPDDKHSATKSINDKINSSGNYWKHDYRIIKPNGKVAFVQDNAYIIRGENNIVTRIIGAIKDVTKQRQEENRLKLLESVVTNTNDTVIITEAEPFDEPGPRIVYANEAFTKMTGYTAEEVIGKTPRILQGPKSDRSELALVRKAIQNWEAHESTIINYKKNGEEFWINFSITPVADEKGWYTHWIAIERDVTKQKLEEERLKLLESTLTKMNRSLKKHVKELAISNQELEQFAYVASHDLQEPLRMVTSFLTQIEKKYEDLLDEKGKKYIFFAVDGAKRMRQIILDLLEFSRVGKKESKLEEVDLNAIVEEIKLLYKKQIEEKKAQINFESLPKIRTYTIPIKQVFQNLISNALKYSKPNEKPVITISCKKNSASWEFEVKDNGIGISEDYFDKIFILFQRLHSKEEYSGTGMGLAITKKIVEKLKGQIWVKSEEGKGTSFYFTIPKKQTT